MKIGGKKIIREIIEDPELEISSMKVSMSVEQKKNAMIQRGLDQKLKSTFKEVSTAFTKSSTFDEESFNKQLRNLLDSKLPESKYKMPAIFRMLSLFERTAFRVALASFLFAIISIPAYYYIIPTQNDSDVALLTDQSEDNWVGITEELVGANADAWVFGEKDIGSVKWKPTQRGEEETLMASRSKSPADEPPGDIPSVPSNTDREIVASRHFKMQESDLSEEVLEKSGDVAKTTMDSTNETEWWQTFNSSKDSSVQKKALLKLEKLYKKNKDFEKLKLVRKKLQELTIN